MSKALRSVMYTLVILFCAIFAEAHANEDPENLPAGFRFIGNYELSSKLRIEYGVATPVVISPLRYRVYSDGIDVRVYCMVSGEESYTSFSIYRSDGIGVVRTSGEIDLVAGVQGYSTKGEMIRQISVTRNSFTMIKAPPRSHRVIITRAVSLSRSDGVSSPKQASDIPEQKFDKGKHNK